MTKIAILAATESEISPVRAFFGDRFTYVATGIGIASTTIETLAAIDVEKPNLVLQIGIAGAIDRGLAIGQAVVVSRDYIADIGAWRGESGFERFATPTFEYPYVVDGFDSVTARTVSTACAPWIEDESQIETMEGAAFMAAAKLRGVRFMQMRVISNYVDEPRGQWSVDQSIAAIAAAISRLLKL